MRILHTMLRVGDLQRSIDFYTRVLGMNLLRTTERPEQKYSLAFVGYGDESQGAVIELTYNYGVDRYDLGAGYGHIAIEVEDAAATCAAIKSAGGNVTREAGPVTAVQVPTDATSPARAQPEPRIQGYWRETDSGFNLELRLPRQLQLTSDNASVHEVGSPSAASELLWQVDVAGGRRVNLTVQPRQREQQSAPHVLVRETGNYVFVPGQMDLDLSLELDIDRAPLRQLRVRHVVRLAPRRVTDDPVEVHEGVVPRGVGVERREVRDRRIELAGGAVLARAHHAVHVRLPRAPRRLHLVGDRAHRRRVLAVEERAIELGRALRRLPAHHGDVVGEARMAHAVVVLGQRPVRGEGVQVRGLRARPERGRVVLVLEGDHHDVAEVRHRAARRRR